MTIKTAHAGHGGIDPGAVGSGRKEAEVARLYNSKIIQLTGAVNATDDTATSVNDNLNKIVAKVNAVSGNDDWNLSIHLNAATPAATGVEVFAYSSDSAGMAKAAEISAKLANVYGIPNRGAKSGDGLFVIKNTKGHMLLIELGFISNANDLNQVLNKIDAACNAIVTSFGYNGGSAPVPENPKPPSQPNPPITGGWAREYNETGTMYATERNWVKDSPTKSATIVEWQEVGQGIKYHKVLWNDGLVWLQLTGWDGKQRYVAYADAVGTGFGRKYGYCK
ncbi:N-acetylmuramoyl-L-alanine amidase [Carnobacterium maltaromaticum]|uniref:N-acetylmuramoyl-L-alanine amidase n=1 Tax=Carnobacterium maltaromaticum TaxID=2751 RepID=UPI0012F888DF|nr:N-acetylmuramoyl-L-alanine amidase [Carnobacterium maltaromaticum]